MRSEKVLEMLEDGKIEELKAALRDEIYQESLKKKPNAKKRYSAMKKYFTYADSVREICQKPNPIEFEGTQYTAFCNAYTLALTTESVGEMELFAGPGNYPDVTRLIKIEGEEKSLDVRKVIAEAKSQGYKLKKYEFFSNRCLLHYDGSYFRIALLDSTFGIIDDGEVPVVYHVTDSKKPLILKTSVGIALIMPINRNEPNPDVDESKIIVEVDA